MEGYNLKPQKIPAKAQASIILAKAEHAWTALKMKHNLILQGFLISALY